MRIQFWICFFLSTFLTKPALAQQKLLNIDQLNLVQAIQQIEQRTDLIFNYDPKALETYQLKGQLSLDNREAYLKQLFYGTPFEFERNGNAVLIFLPEEREYRICGTILDAVSKVPLPLANVYTSDFRYGAQTDEKGGFDLRVKGQKNQAIIVSYVGYQSDSLIVQDFDAKPCKEILLSLDPSLFGEGIIVTDYILAGVTEGESYSGVEIDFEQISKRTPNIEQDILKTVQLLPGITSIDETAANIQIRGGTADQNLVLWEGVTLYDPGHFFGMISSINPFVVDKVKIYKGVFESSYANRVGGIIDMSLSDSLASEVHAGIGSTLTEGHAFFEVPLLKNRLSLMASGRNTLNALFDTPTLENYGAKVFQETKVDVGDEIETDQVLNFYDWNTKLLFQPIDAVLLSASYFRSANRFDFNVPNFFDEFSSNDFIASDSRALSISLQIQANDKWESKVLYTTSSFENDYTFVLSELEDSIRLENYSAFNDINESTFSISNKWSVNEDMNFHFGYEYNQKEVNFNISFNALYEQNYEDVNFSLASFHNGFLSWEYQRPKLQINTGLRAIYYNETNSWSFSPRLNLQYALADGLKAKFSAGILQQYISQLRQFAENDLGINSPVWIINRTEVEDFQEADKISAGFVVEKGRWLLDIDAYYTQTSGLNTYSPLFGQNTTELEFSNGSSIARGLDLLLRKRWKNYDIWLNYSLSEVSFLFPDIEEGRFPGTNDHRHNLSLINSWSYKNWSFTLSYLFRTGLRYSPAESIGDFYIEEEDETYYTILYEDLNSELLKSYARLDLGISYQYKFLGKGPNAELAFSIINLLDTENTFSRSYFLQDENDDDIPESIGAVDKLMLSRTPQLLLRVYW